MRKSLRDIETIDRYLLERMSPAEAEVFRARLLLDADLAAQVRWHQRAHRLIRLEGLFDRVMRDPAYRSKVEGLWAR